MRYPPQIALEEVDRDEIVVRVIATPQAPSDGAALATGTYPEHSGILANIQYRPELSWTGTYGTENYDAIRRADLLSDGHYLGAATLAEILQGPVINALVVELAPAGNPGPHLSIFQLSWSVGQTIAPAVLLGLLSAGPSWLWATTIGLCLIIFLGINQLAPTDQNNHNHDAKP